MHWNRNIQWSNNNTKIFWLQNFSLKTANSIFLLPRPWTNFWLRNWKRLFRYSKYFIVEQNTKLIGLQTWIAHSLFFVLYWLANNIAFGSETSIKLSNFLTFVLLCYFELIAYKHKALIFVNTLLNTKFVWLILEYWMYILNINILNREN